MYIVWWAGAVLCMNTAFVLSRNLLQDCDQDTFFLNVLSVLCICHFLKYSQKTFLRFLYQLPVVLLYTKKIKLKSNFKYSSRKTQIAVFILIRIQTQKLGSTCWFNGVSVQFWVSNSLCLFCTWSAWSHEQPRHGWFPIPSSTCSHLPCSVSAVRRAGLSRKHFRLPCQFDVDHMTSLWRGPCEYCGSLHPTCQCPPTLQVSMLLSAH